MGTANSRQFAVVTGASSGIGFELARQCIEHDFDVLICAHDGRGIHEAAAHLGASGAVVIPVVADLSTTQGNEKLVREIESTGRHVDALILNAGIGVHGPFVETPLDEELCSILLNCASIVHVAKRIVPPMVVRGKGRILITASLVSTSPTPYMAVYGATKAFDLAFAEALRVELADSGVTVTALQPGATDTEFFDRAEMEDTKVAQGKKDDPADVARRGFDAMMKGKDKVIAASFKSKLFGVANELLPETLKARIEAAELKPGSGKH
ncbi:MAG TPA: SDR family NAD(P)-dependent oxidoreductase [Xanthomonadales bacterium]|nr:SDR family NAD(P)-dependent oxidoreductase [Xanthomonadales bacterium]